MVFLYRSLYFLAGLSATAWPAPAAFKSAMDERIPADVRKSIEDKERPLLEAIHFGNLDNLKNVLTESNRISITAEFRDLLASLPEIVDSKFLPFHDFKIDVTTSEGASLTIPSGQQPPFSILLGSRTGTNFVRMRTAAAPASHEAGLTLILGEIWNFNGTQWSLSDLNIGILKRHGKDVFAWMKEARALQKQNKFHAAHLCLQDGAATVHPLTFFSYGNGAKESYEKLLSDVGDTIKRRYPEALEMRELKSKPKIYALRPGYFKGRYAPAIVYVSDLPMDPKHLEEEARKMYPLVEKYFPGVKDLSGYVSFHAYAEPPSDPQKKYRGYVTLINSRGEIVHHL